MISDITLQTLRQSLSGLAMQRQAIQDNIANVETPGYLANSVSFESSLRDALADGDPRNMQATTVRSTAPTRVNGNNVAIDQEMVALTENGLVNSLMVEAVNAKYRLLRAAMAQ